MTREFPQSDDRNDRRQDDDGEREAEGGGAVEASVAPPVGEEVGVPRLGPPRRRRGKRLVKKPELPRGPLSPAQRLLLLDTWKRSGLPAADFAALVGVSKHTLYAWRSRFKENGPAGLEGRPRGGPRGSRLPEVTKRAILLMKEEHPEWGHATPQRHAVPRPGAGRFQRVRVF